MTAGLGTSAGSGILSASGKPAINALNPPPMKTLIYTPAARIIIAHGSKQYDVSGDLVDGGCLRPENAAAAVRFTLNNANLRYNGLFDRMDRIVLFLKRIKMIQVFSGYLDDVPYLQLYPGTVTFRATCSLKRLMYTWWDPSTDASIDLFSSSDTATQVQGDGTTTGSNKPIGNIIRDLLTNVGSWDPSQVHIENFPPKYLQLAQQWVNANAGSQEAAISQFQQDLLGDDHSAGAGANASANPALTLGPAVMGAPNYIATMVNICDQVGLGPTTSDIALSQSLINASKAGQASFQIGKDAGWPALQAQAQNQQQQYRNNDAAILALACSMVETEPGPRILANPAVQGSDGYYHDGEGNNGTSVGLYQQISGGQWGDVAQRMNPEASTRAFYIALNKIDWRNMDPGAAIQQVQGSAFPEKYSGMIAAATAAVQTFRQSLTGGGSTSGNSNSSALSVAGLIGTSQNMTSLIPGLGPTGGGGASPVSASQIAGVAKPSPDAMGAIACGLTYVGSPYNQIRPPIRGVGVDCSGLTYLAYMGININIGTNTDSQKGQLAGRQVSASQISPGDLVFPNGMDHTFMWLGSGYPGGSGDMILESSGSNWDGKDPCSDGPEVKPNHYNLANCQIFHAADFGGWDLTVKYNEPSTAGGGYAPGTFGSSTVGTGVSALGASGGDPSEPVARNLFTYEFNYPAYAPKIDQLFTGEFSLLQCDPLMQIIQTLCNATLRNFCSSPTGDFVAYFPDYFGISGKQAVMTIEDIEVKDISINLSDYSLITHAFVATGDSSDSSSFGTQSWLSAGLASVENPSLLAEMAKSIPSTGESLDGKEILARYGARPFSQAYPMVQDATLREFLAIHHFMKGWANQFATNVSFTFMPELFPGMRINLNGHNLQCYVTEVQHTFSYTAGFSTTATITAPSVPNGTMQINQSTSTSPAPLEANQNQVRTGWWGT